MTELTRVIRLVVLVVLLMGPLAMVGCIERTITITSDPSGALVHLNDEEVGRTPVVVPFTFYGTYTVRLEHDGVWLPEQEAGVILGFDEAAMQEAIDTGRVQTRPGETGREIRMDYAAKLIHQKAKAPIYEYPGLDLFAEAMPGRNTVNLDWHFVLERQPLADEAELIERAQQLRDRLGEVVGDLPDTTLPTEQETPADGGDAGDANDDADDGLDAGAADGVDTGVAESDAGDADAASGGNATDTDGVDDRQPRDEPDAGASELDQAIEQATGGQGD